MLLFHTYTKSITFSAIAERSEKGKKKVRTHVHTVSNGETGPIVIKYKWFIWSIRYKGEIYSVNKKSWTFSKTFVFSTSQFWQWVIQKKRCIGISQKSNRLKFVYLFRHHLHQQKKILSIVRTFKHIEMRTIYLCNFKTFDKK